MAENIEVLKEKLANLEKLRIELYGQEAIDKYENEKQTPKNLNEEQKKDVKEEVTENKDATRGLFFGVLSLFALPFLFGIAFNFARKGLKKSKEHGVGKGLSIAGIVLSIIAAIELFGFILLFYLVPAFRMEIMSMFTGVYY